MLKRKKVMIIILIIIILSGVAVGSYIMLQKPEKVEAEKTGTMEKTENLEAEKAETVEKAERDKMISQFAQMKHDIEMKDFDNYEDDYNGIIKLVERYTIKLKNSESPFLFVSYYKGKYKVSHEGKSIKLTKEEYKSLKKIDQSFSNISERLTFDSIWPAKDRVAFGTEQNHYYLVYMYKDIAPTYVTDEQELKEGKKYYVSKIKPHWYNISRNPN